MRGKHYLHRRARWPSVDLTLTLFNLVVCGVYLWFAAGSFYGSRGVARVPRRRGLAVAILTVALAYRFTIFLITLWWA